jgi:hypothetical protein
MAADLLKCDRKSVTRQKGDQIDPPLQFSDLAGHQGSGSWLIEPILFTTIRAFPFTVHRSSNPLLEHFRVA